MVFIPLLIQYGVKQMSSTFKQIVEQVVEGYAGNVEQQRHSMDYEGANDRAIDKIRSEKIINSLNNSVHHLSNVVRKYNNGDDVTNYDLSPGKTFGVYKTLNDFLNTDTLNERDLLPVYHTLIRHQAIVNNNDILPTFSKLDDAVIRIEKHKNANNIIPELKKLRIAMS
jgi:hypothetical protein